MSPQDFALVKTLEDASDSVCCTSWSQSLLLAAGGLDKVVRIYDAGQVDMGRGMVSDSRFEVGSW